MQVGFVLNECFFLSINFKIFDIKHVVYMAFNEFLWKKRQLPRKIARGGGVLTSSTCIHVHVYIGAMPAYILYFVLLTLGNVVSGPVCGKKFGDQTFIGKWMNNWFIAGDRGQTMNGRKIESSCFYQKTWIN